MLDLCTGRAVARRRSTRRAWLLARLAVLAAAVLGAAAVPGGPPQTAALAVPTAPAHGSRPLIGGTAEAGGPLSLVADTSAEAQAAATSSDAHTAVHTMSMDAPIQGGLTAHQEQALSARLLNTHQAPAVAPQSRYWTPAMGISAAARAQSWLGMPYSWAGGNASGPTRGRCDPGTGGDLDCHVIGFDCSGLAMYAWGPYASLPHLAAAQLDAGMFHPSLKQLLPGDLVFFSAYLPGGTGHVAIYAGHGMVIEAPQSGAVIRRAPLADLLAEDGEYRGAVRPLTGQTPTLTAHRVRLPLSGGMLTLPGRHLAGVDAVTIGDATVRHFVSHSDSAITFHAPAHFDATVAVTVSTSWGAESRSVFLTYARARHVSPSPPVVSPTPTSPSPTPTSPSPTPTSPSPTPTSLTPSVSSTVSSPSTGSSATDAG